MSKIKLSEIADARSGDKGSNSNIGVIAHDPGAYAILEKTLTAKAVKEFLSPLGIESVERYALPNLMAFNFVLKGILAGGGSRSLRLDSQGKVLGQALLEMEIEK